MRYGDCKDKHAEVTIKRAIRQWAIDRESIDGINRSASEIEEIIKDQFASIDDYAACNWLGCEAI